MIQVEGINVAYGKNAAKVLEDVSLTIKDGEIVSIIGANGAGKSSVLKVISGLLKPLSGGVFLDGKPLPQNPVDVVKSGIVMVPEGRHIFPSMSVTDNLKVGGHLRSEKEISASIGEMFDLFPILKERSNQSAGTLSGGEQQMLAIARGMMAKPKVMLLDEPSLGLAPVIYYEVFRYLKEMNAAKGITMLIVEQNANLAFDIADRVYVLELGKINHEGTPEDIRNNPEIIKAYLGV